MPRELIEPQALFGGRVAVGKRIDRLSHRINLIASMRMQKIVVGDGPARSDLERRFLSCAARTRLVAHSPTVLNPSRPPRHSYA